MTGGVVFTIMVAPAVWILFRGVRTSRPVEHLYALTLYATFFSTTQIVSGMPNPAIILAGMAVGSDLVRTLLRGTRLTRPNLLDAGVLILLAWTTLHTVIHGEIAIGLRSGIVLSMVVLSTKLRPAVGPRFMMLLMQSLFMGSFVVALSIWVQGNFSATLFGLHEMKTIGGHLFMSRMTGIANNPNLAAFFLVLGTAAACGGIWGRLASNSLRRALLTVVAVAFLGWAIVATQSRAGLFAYGIVFYLYLGSLARISTKYLLPLAGAMFGLLTFLQPESVLTYVETNVFTDRPSMAISGRETHFKLAIDTIMNSFWFGDPSVEFHHRQIHYHNATLQLAANNGVPAALGFLTMLFAAFRACLRATKENWGQGLGISALCLCVGGVTMSIAHEFLTSSIAFWLVLGFVVNVVGATSGDGTPPPKGQSLDAAPVGHSC